MNVSVFLGDSTQPAQFLYSPSLAQVVSTPVLLLLPDRTALKQTQNLEIIGIKLCFNLFTIAVQSPVCRAGFGGSQLWAEPAVGGAGCGWKEGFDESLPSLHVDLYKETLDAWTVGGSWLYDLWEGCVH